SGLSAHTVYVTRIVLGKVIRDQVYKSLAKFAKLHCKASQANEGGFDSLKPNFNPSYQQKSDDDKN
ncbi:6650_t:CDS:1, partial [Funneliformis caledonium]